MQKSFKTHNMSLTKVLPIIFLVGGVIGLIASFALTYDKIQVLKNPSYNPPCNISPILSCGSVMKTQQASLLGVPNTIFGLMGFSALIALAIALLAGAQFKKWLWQAINIGLLGGFIFFLYLFFQGVYRINAICPYCFAVWMIMPPLFWYTTLYNLRAGNIRLGISQKAQAFAINHRGDILTLWYILIFSLLVTHFWYYWRVLV